MMNNKKIQNDGSLTSSVYHDDVYRYDRRNKIFQLIHLSLNGHPINVADVKRYFKDNEEIGEALVLALEMLSK